MKKLTIKQVEKKCPTMEKRQVWRGNHAKYWFFCPSCNRRFKRFYRNVSRDPKSGCRPCSQKMTIEELELRFPDMEKGQTFRGVYKKYWFSCAKHGRYLQSANCHLRSIKKCGSHRCPKCNRYVNRKYFHNPLRESMINCKYRVNINDIHFLYAHQKGKCLWCMQDLPSDPLSCPIDHIGGQKAKRNRNAVRGLCCLRVACNMFAGRIEKDLIISKHIVKVLETNKGNILPAIEK